MKVRIKFSKEGPVKFVGHLDTMRYFQKAVRRAELPAAFSGGYSPHMIMSFAAPLGVGSESLGEYFDIELTDTVPTGEISRRLNEVMAEGFRVISARCVEDKKAGNAMSLVAAADYLVRFRQGKEPPAGWEGRIEEFCGQASIPVCKKTKKGERLVDIRPCIYQMQAQEDGLFLKLASASSNYTKPELVADTFLRWLGREPAPSGYLVKRLEVYAARETEGKEAFVSLESLGEKIE